MSEEGKLLPTLKRLFAGPPNSVLTLDEFLRGLEGRSYAFAIAAIDIINVVPTGIPWLSTVTGIPMLILLAQYFMGKPVPSLPRMVGRRGLPRSKLQKFLDKCGRHIARLEARVHPRRTWWITGAPRQALLVTLLLLTILLTLPIPFDNLIPAIAILFFCLALMEDDGVMAILGWITTVITVFWTIFLVMLGHAAIMAILKAIKGSVLGD
jgi:hypothetical protein